MKGNDFCACRGGRAWDGSDWTQTVGRKPYAPSAINDTTGWGASRLVVQCRQRVPARRRGRGRAYPSASRAQSAPQPNSWADWDKSLQPMRRRAAPRTPAAKPVSCTRTIRGGAREQRRGPPARLSGPTPTPAHSAKPRTQEQPGTWRPTVPRPPESAPLQTPVGRYQHTLQGAPTLRRPRSCLQSASKPTSLCWLERVVTIGDSY
jgi:hypothetical protein